MYVPVRVPFFGLITIQAYDWEFLHQEKQLQASMAATNGFQQLTRPSVTGKRIVIHIRGAVKFKPKNARISTRGTVSKILLNIIIKH